MFTHGVVALGRGDKVAGDEFCALMNELIKGVLPVCARLSPDDVTCLVIYIFACAVHRFSITLHKCLLQISRESV